MSWFSPTSAGAAGGSLATSAIGSNGGLSSGDLSTALQNNPLLAGLKSSDVTGASAAQPAAKPGILGSLLSPTGGGGSGSIGGPVNSALGVASMIPGPQQPFVQGASMLAPIVEGIFGGGGKAPPAPTDFPTLQKPQGQPIVPVTAPHVQGISGPLGGSGLNPQLMKLIQMLSGGGGGLS